VVDIRHAADNRRDKYQCRTLDYPLHGNNSFVIKRYVPEPLDNGLRRKKMRHPPGQHNSRTGIKQNLINHNQS